MRSVTCPNCGAAVRFRAGTSVFAVCEFCQSTLLADDKTIANLGRMAELLPDPTRLQIGTEGRFGGEHFAVIGRIQMQYERGVWNEWHLLYDSGKAGWLSEVAGEYFLTFEQPAAQQLPAFDKLAPGSTIGIAGERFTVTDLQRARCIAGAGELPFRIGAGYDAPVADLRSALRFATIDYSDEIARLFIGQSVDRAALALTNLRAADAFEPPTATGRSLPCPACGSSLSVSSAAIRTLACRQCGAVLDPADPKASVLRAAAGKAKLQPTIPVGATGTFGKDRFEIIGYMQRSAVGDAGPGWGEYLLFSAERGFRWLIESSGHWTLTDPPLSNPPLRAASNVRLDGRRYLHFAGYEATVNYVVGEFTWQVKAGDTCAVADYIDPPRILSYEKTPTELTVTRGSYLAAPDIGRAFALKTPLPAPTGVAPNQPSPYRRNAWIVFAMFLLFSLALLVIQFGFGLQSGRPTSLMLSFPADAAEANAVSAPFRLPASRHLVLRTDGFLDNASANLDIRLVQKSSGKVFAAEQGLEHWSGVEDGERWTEGERSAEVQFRDVPAGEYQLAVAIEQQGPGRKLTEATFRFEPQRVGWSNWFLAQLLLVLCPLWAGARQWNFEVTRWADSDHPKGRASASDDDD